MSITLYANPFVFFLLKSNKIIVWDYKNHQQFEIEEDYFQRLKYFTPNATIAEISPIDCELLSGNLLSENPYEEIKWGWDELSLIYHIGTQNIDGGGTLDRKGWLENYLLLSEESTNEAKTPKFIGVNARYKLPDPQLEKISHANYLKTITSRKTTRVFDSKKMSLLDVSTLLFLSFGKVHGEWKELISLGFKDINYRRTSPSGGALHPVEAFVFIYEVEDISSGIYFYDSGDHSLTYISEIPEYCELSDALCSQYFTEGISIGIFLTGFFDRVWGKYLHSRSYKDIYLDAGHVSQTCLLTATALNLRTWITAWFKDEKIATFLNISGIDVAPLSFIGIGSGPDKILPS